MSKHATTGWFDVRPRGCAIAVLAALALLAPSLAGAEFEPTGEEVAISAGDGATARNPSLAWGGRSYQQFLIAWDEERAETGLHIVATVSDGSPESNGIVQIDAEDENRNDLPDVTATRDGAYIVVWRRTPGDGEQGHIVGTRVDDDGVPFGSEFRVSTERDVPGEYYLGAPRVAATSDGGFVVVWSSGTEDDEDERFGPASDIFARRFNSQNVPVGDDVVVSVPGGTGYQLTEFRPDVAATEIGEFIVVWAKGEMQQFGSAFATHARRLDSLGQPAGTEIVVGDGGLSGPRVAAQRTGGFRVSWSTYEYIDYVPGGGGEVLARSFDSTGEPLGPAFVVSAPSEDEELKPFAGADGVSITNGGADELVMAWTSGSVFGPQYGGSTDGDGSGIFSRATDFAGAPFGQEWQANQTVAGNQINPDVAIGANGEGLVVWEGDRIYARRFEIIIPHCADTDRNEYPQASDALFILQAALGARACADCVCDVDGSGTKSAADALLALRRSVDLEAPFDCPVCPDPFAVEFSLETDAPCYGAYVLVPREGLPRDTDELECQPSAALEEAGCEVEEYPYYGFTLEVRGCFIDSQPLFTCHVSPAVAESVALTAQVSCGCGCADTCPAATALCASVEEGPVCTPGMSLAAVSPMAPPPVAFTTVTATQALVTSTTTCGTCCDYTVSADVDLLEQAYITELVMRFQAERSTDCPDEEVECESAIDTDGPGYTRAIGDQVEVCLTSDEGIFGPALLATCSLVAGDFSGPVEIVRALDYTFRPIDPAPAIVIDDGF